ncbi:putative sterigmatocystin 8-o-methyltransferase [Phaeomoniella chlamydospora]|uniref:Putative sterigmatocystin 8-o-methyltransferase n=1 Tax=Phaeomoniella chlamydospora TaxID=158046 RepID=A0A0G2GT69_PHACM|nr:putative sterigmatocystin 8-o-methyltransferase [Phaeomoniella chlamydospora]
MMFAHVDSWRGSTSNNLACARVEFQSFGLIQATAAFRWLWRFQIHKHIPLRGDIPTAEVAESAGVPLAQLQTVSRVAITTGYLLEPRAGYLCHSAASALVASDPDYAGYAFVLTELFYKASDKVIEATEKWGDTTKNTETGYCLAFQTEKPMFGHLFQDKTRATMFPGFTRAIAKTGERDPRFLVEGFDWSGTDTIVDVGGGRGYATIAVLNRFPSIKNCIVQDLPHVVAGAKEEVPPTLSETLASKVKFEVHDFFTPQPDLGENGGQRVFVLRQILHDWPDDKVKQILEGVVPILRKHDRILIQDVVLPSPSKAAYGQPLVSGEQDPATEQALLQEVKDHTRAVFAASMSQLMMTLLHGRERTLEEFGELCASVDERLTIKKCVTRPGSNLGVIEIGLGG